MLTVARARSSDRVRMEANEAKSLLSRAKLLLVGFIVVDQAKTILTGT